MIIIQHGGHTPADHPVYSGHLWYWTSMLWSIDTCQNKVSTDQYHVTISWAQVEAHRGQLFFEVDRWPGTGFQLDGRLKPGQIRALSRKLGAAATSLQLTLVVFRGVKVENDLEKNSYLRKKAHQVHVHVSKYNCKVVTKLPHCIGLRSSVQNNIRRLPWLLLSFLLFGPVRISFGCYEQRNGLAGFTFL